MEFNYKHLLETATKACILAGKEILHQYYNGFDTITKPDDSPVTSADMAANEILTQHLAPTGIKVLSEEGDKFTHQFRQNNPYWCIDPIDGTRDFVSKTNEFCISVGLVSYNTSMLGVLYAPALDLFYFAAENVGSFKFSGTADDLNGLIKTDNLVEKLILRSQKLPVIQHPNEKIFMASRYHRSDKIEKYIADMRLKMPDLELVTIGSAIKLGMMAEGKANEYLRYNRFNFWDVAGGHAIAKYAGLHLLQPHTTKEISYIDEQMKIEGYALKWK